MFRVQTRPLILCAAFALIGAILTGVAPGAGTQSIRQIEAYAQLDVVLGWEGQVTLEVYRGDDQIRVFGPVQSWHGFDLWQEGFDLLPGDTVKVFDDETSKQAVVTDQVITSVDTDPDMGHEVCGTAESETEIALQYGYIAEQFSGQGITDPVVAAEGQWCQTIAEDGYVLGPGSFIEATTFESPADDNDQTKDVWFWPAPTITVRPPGIVEGQFWPFGVTVDVAIDDTIVASPTTSRFGLFPWEGWFQVHLDAEIVPESVVTATASVTEPTSLVIEKSHIVVDLVVDPVDYQGSVVSGSLPTTGGVHVVACESEQCQELWTTANDEGWRADFGAANNSFSQDVNGDVRVYDGDGDATAVGFGGGSDGPQIWADLSHGGLSLMGFEPGSTQAVTITDPEGRYTEQYQGWKWIEGQWSREFAFDGDGFEVQPEELGFPLRPGMAITVGEKELVIPDGFTIDTFDISTDVVGGTAPDDPAYGPIEIVLGGDQCGGGADVVHGRWSFDASTACPGYDLEEGSLADARLPDEDGDYAIVWWMRPRFAVSLEGPVRSDDSIEGSGWPYGTELRIVVQGDTQRVFETTVDGLMHYNGGEEGGVVDVFRGQSSFSFYDFGEDFRFEPGWRVTIGPASSESPYPTKVHVVTDVVPTGVDLEENKVFGTAEPDTDVVVYGCPVDWPSYDWEAYQGALPWGGAWNRVVTADGNGDWVADFGSSGIARFDASEADYRPVSETCELSGFEFGANQVDEDFDETQRQYLIPHIDASLNAGEWIMISRVNTEPKLVEILSEPGGEVRWGEIVEPVFVPPEEGGGVLLEVGSDSHGVDLHPGMVVRVSGNDRVMGELTLAELTLDFDVESDRLFGTAPGSDIVSVNVGGDFGWCWGEVEVEADGTWVATEADLNGESEWGEGADPPACEEFELTKQSHASISVEDPSDDYGEGSEAERDRTRLEWMAPPRWIKEDLLSFMENVLAPELSRSDATPMQLAIDGVTASLSDALWDDYRTLDPRRGVAVFEHEARAAKSLSRIKGTATLCEDGVCVEVSGDDVAGGLAWADKQIAEHAVSIAEYAGGAECWLDLARTALAAGDEASSLGEHRDAIKSYAEAWRYAQSASQSCPDDQGDDNDQGSG